MKGSLALMLFVFYITEPLFFLKPIRWKVPPQPLSSILWRTFAALNRSLLLCHPLRLTLFSKLWTHLSLSGLACQVFALHPIFCSVLTSYTEKRRLEVGIGSDGNRWKKEKKESVPCSLCWINQPTNYTPGEIHWHLIKMNDTHTNVFQNLEMISSNTCMCSFSLGGQ